MLKRIGYETASPQYPGEVVYAVLGDTVVFSGITTPGSTINFAEDIVEKIASQEGVEISRYRWFDLQTHRGYDSYPSGTCDFDELLLGDHADVPRWIPRSAPQEVLDLFREHIGELSIKIWKPEEARRAGYAPSNDHHPMSGWCCQMLGIQGRLTGLVRELPTHLRSVAARFVSPSVMDTSVIVDHEGNEDRLAISKGDRYCIWRRSTIPQN